MLWFRLSVSLHDIKMLQWSEDGQETWLQQRKYRPLYSGVPALLLLPFHFFVSQFLTFIRCTVIPAFVYKEHFS